VADCGDGAFFLRAGRLSRVGLRLGMRGELSGRLGNDIQL
jgi:hypothetical protein